MIEMANSYTQDPTKGLSRLQKSILAWLAEERSSFLAFWEDPGALEAFGRDRMPEDPLFIPWNFARPSFYGGKLPIWDVFGGGRWASWQYTEKERAAVSRSLARLAQRGLVIRQGQGQTSSVALTEKGATAAVALIEQGASPEYKDLAAKSRDQIKALCLDMLKVKDSSELPEAMASMIEREPAGALKALMIAQIRMDVNRFGDQDEIESKN